MSLGDGPCARIFRDLFTNCELFTDVFPVKDIDDFYYEVTGKHIVKLVGEDGVPTPGAAGTQHGSYTSSSSHSEDASDDYHLVKSANVINLVHMYQHQPIALDRASFIEYIRKYIKRVSAHLEKHHTGRLESFHSKAQKYVKRVLASFANYEFYTVDNIEGQTSILIFVLHSKDLTPIFHFWKDGCTTEFQELPQFLKSSGSDSNLTSPKPKT